MTSLFSTPASVRYDAPSDPKAILVLVHGMAEHSGRYGPAIEFFTSRGVVCCRFDHRGHGKTPREECERGDVRSFGDFVSDTVAVIDDARAKYSEVPLFVWGHSMGAIVAVLAAGHVAKDGPGKIRGVITSSPPIAAFDFLPRIVLRGLTWLSYVMPRKRLSRPFRPERLSRDLDVGMKYGADPLVPKAITLRLLAQLAQSCALCLTVARRLRMPWLVLHGTDDEIAPPIGSQRLLDALGSPDKQLRLWPGARHELQNEIEPARTEFLECIGDWMRERS